MGTIPPQMQPYQVPYTNPGSASSGGLVNVTGQIREAQMQAQNMMNQRQLASESKIDWEEKQHTAAQAAKYAQNMPDNADNRAAWAKNNPGQPYPTDASNATNPNPYMNPGATQDFFGPVLHALHGIGTAAMNAVGIGRQPAIPAPNPAPAAPAPQVAAPAVQAPAPAPMEDGGVVSNVWNAVKDAAGRVVDAVTPNPGPHNVGTGAAEKAASNIDTSAQHRAMDAADAMSKMKGGAITDRAPALPFMQGPTSGLGARPAQILAFEQGGAVPAFGVMDGGVHGLRGFAEGGTVPQDANAPPPGIALPSAAPDPQTHLNNMIEGYFKHLDDKTLDESDEPKGSKGIATPLEAISKTEATNRVRSGGYMGNGQPAPPDAVVDTQAPTPPSGSTPAAAAAINQAGSQGASAPAPGAAGSTPAAAPGATPETTDAVINASQSAREQGTDPGPTDHPKSLTPKDWADSEAYKEAAISAASAAGRDPGQVRAAMDASRNAWVQGGTLKYMAIAHAAALTGNWDAVEKAMQNAYYYLPDGAELHMDKKGPNGQLQYQDPINPFMTADGHAVPSQVKGSVPNMIPVDVAHIQQVGMALLDPMNVQQMINNVRIAQSQVGLAGARGAAATELGAAAIGRSQALQTRANAEAYVAPSKVFENTATGQARLNNSAAYLTKMQKLTADAKVDPALANGATKAAEDTEKAIQGQLTTVQGDPNNNPNVGKSTRDPTKSALPGATPLEVQNARGLAGNLFVGAAGKISTAEAQRLAILGVAAQRPGAVHDALPGEKPDPKLPPGKVSNFHIDTNGTVHIWNPATRRYEIGKVAPTTAATVRGGGTFSVDEPPTEPGSGASVAANGGETGEATPAEADAERGVVTGSSDVEPS